TRMNRRSEAMEYFRKVIDLDPKSPEAHLNLGIALADQFNLEGALAEFSEAVRLDPNGAAAHYNKGRVLLDLRRNDEAKPELEAATRLDPKSSESWYLLGLIEKAAGNAGASVQMLRTAAALDPRNPDTLFVLGQQLLRTGDRTGAIAQWRTVIQIKPDHGEALYNLSRQLAKSDPQEAQRFQERFETLQAQKHVMDRAQTLGNFALSAAAAHDWPQAIAQLKEGLQVCGACSALALLHKDLGLTYCRSGDLKNGLTELLEAKKLTPQDPDIDQAIRFAENAQK
ncbi:MAG TPA: tetratricopeptide repeat protein, partial [Terriglobales bacterium]|nr:tetratricopeptide repeat protein [Terriglobales bacterium]